VPDKKLSARYPTDLPAWQKLKAHYREDMKKRRIADLFARDRQRPQNFSVRSGDLYLDYSKNLLSATTRNLLLSLAKQANVADAVDAMFAGDHINATEDRAALHVALRSKLSDQVGHKTPGIRAIWHVLNDMDEYVTAVNDGEIKGHSGKYLSNIVNIGIGGSDLGAVMAARALRHHFMPGMRFYSVSNIDGTQLTDLVAELDPASTLFVICSKTFTTLETVTNANAAKEWIISTLGADAVASHFVAASTNQQAMDAFGIHPRFRFAFWDWVGGRYSIWSAVGLSLALVIGMQNFNALLEGARRMDMHFRQAPFAENMPVLLALLSIWYNNFFGAQTQAILPYDNRLDRLPAFLQQLHMESNGKSVRRDGRLVKTDTGMIIWGEAGSNAQHSFYQLLHQGTRLVPVDFILPAHSSGGRQAQQDLAVSNCLAQGEALMDGFSKQQAEGDMQRVHPGNRPSNTLLFSELTPATLGQLIALYEHKVLVEATIWGINPFDQYGVELGKSLAGTLSESKNPSTRQLQNKLNIRS
jgi:glucose-6-phosphate isomerase